MTLSIKAKKEIQFVKEKGGRLIKIPKDESKLAIALKEDKRRNFTDEVAYISAGTTAELKNIVAASGEVFLALNYVLNKF